MEFSSTGLYFQWGGEAQTITYNTVNAASVELKEAEDGWKCTINQSARTITITPPADPDPAPAAEPAPAAPAPDNTELISAIQDLKKTIQASNIASTPQPVQETLQDKADDVLMKLVNM